MASSLCATLMSHLLCAHYVYWHSLYDSFISPQLVTLTLTHLHTIHIIHSNSLATHHVATLHSPRDNQVTACQYIIVLEIPSCSVTMNL